MQMREFGQPVPCKWGAHAPSRAADRRPRRLALRVRNRRTVPLLFGRLSVVGETPTSAREGARAPQPTAWHRRVLGLGLVDYIIPDFPPAPRKIKTTSLPDRLLSPLVASCRLFFETHPANRERMAFRQFRKLFGSGLLCQRMVGRASSRASHHKEITILK